MTSELYHSKTLKTLRSFLFYNYKMDISKFNDAEFTKKYKWFIKLLNWIADNKAAPMVWNAGYSFGSSTNKDLDKFIKEFEKQNDLKNLFYKFEYSLSLYGASVLFFDDKNQLRIANPIYPIYVQTDGEIPQMITFIETNKGFIANNWYKLIQVNKDGIAISRGQQPSMTTGAAIPLFYKDMDEAKINQLAYAEWIPNKNKDGLNAVWCLNYERYNAMIYSINYRIPDAVNVPQEIFENLTFAWYSIVDDIFVSRNKIVLKDDKLGAIKKQAQLTNTWDEYNNRIYQSLQSMIIRSQKGEVLGGKEIGTDFLKGSPNSMTLWQNFWNHWELFLAFCGYATFKDNSNYSTATANRLSKDLDLITTDKKRNLRESQFIKLFDRVCIENGFWDGKGKRPYYFSIHDVPVNDKESGLQRIKQLEDFGYISHTDAMMMLFPNRTKEENEQKLKEIIQEKEKYLVKIEQMTPQSQGGFDQNHAQNQANKKSENPDKSTQEKQALNNNESSK